ncbi:MAG: membrane protein insertion efficiency factor YidD [Oscillospiraceae bacterium]|nr:membrane protein insertion efficiency factor YidD [Oscillospiraceae bacterium]
MKKWLLSLVRFYQRNISPAFPARCRFRPTCSAYAYEAISKYGVCKGGLLALRRFLKCHPFYKGDIFDPVP